MEIINKTELINKFNISELFLNVLPNRYYAEKVINNDYVLIIKKDETGLVYGIVVVHDDYYYWHTPYYSNKLTNGYTLFI
jgi:hypothetical protein